MAKKELGYVELEWTCQRCGTKNPGLQKTCSSCGAPMPAEQQFENPAGQQLISDEQKLAAARQGADIHCPYCGARNPAGAQTCVQCGGDLKEGVARQAGQVVGAFQAGPVPEIDCPFCAAKVKANAQRCPNCGGDLRKKEAPTVAPPAKAQKMPLWMMVLIGVFLAVCCGGIVVFAMLSARTEDMRGQVQSVNWERSIAIQEERPAKKSDWQDSLPAGAQNVACKDEYRETRSEPAPKSTEVCGTPYTVDQGSGVGKVVQDCEYRVYDSKCDYTVLEWQDIDNVVAQDNNLQPYWPDLQLEAGQREGNRQEEYLVIFSAGDKQYRYTVNDAAEFTRFTPGSQWTLKVNTFGGVNAVEP